MSAVALMSLDDRVLHAPGPVHGMAMCGEQMRDPWMAGPIDMVLDRSEDYCPVCYEVTRDL